jgi:hypothetical protein
VSRYENLRTWGGVAAACLLLAGPAAAAEGDDDLALVRRAMASAERPPAVEPPRSEPERSRVARSPEQRSAPAWLKVRIADDDDGASLSLDLPLALVRAIDDLACDDEDAADPSERRSGLGDLLAGLVSGQPLVSIEADDAEVRVWVE